MYSIHPQNQKDTFSQTLSVVFSFYSSANMDSTVFNWKIDSNANSFLMVPNGKSFSHDSTFQTTDGTQWYLQIYPNVCKPEQSGYASVFLFADTIPECVWKKKSVDVNYSIQIIDEEFEFDHTFTKENVGYGNVKAFKTSKFFGLKFVSIKCTIKLKNGPFASLQQTHNSLKTERDQMVATIKTKEDIIQKLQIQNNAQLSINKLNEDITYTSLEEKIKRLEKETKYVLHHVKDINDCDVDDIKNQIDYQPYHDTITEHQITMSKWNQDTDKLCKILSFIQQKNSIQMDNDEDKKDGEEFGHMHNSGSKLIDKYVEVSSTMDVQSKRLQQITSSTEYIVQIMQQMTQLVKLTQENQSASASNTQECEQFTMKYDKIKKERIELQDIIQDQTNKCNSKIDEENTLFTQTQNTVKTQAHLKQQLEQLTKTKHQFSQLINLYNTFIKDNEQYIEELNDYFIDEWNRFEMNWFDWSPNDIIAWMQYKLLEKNTDMIDLPNVFGELQSRNICGVTLNDFDVTYLDLINIQDFKINKYLMKEITDLRNKYPQKEDKEQTSQRDIKVPSRFICKLTNKVMKDPVIAFDGNLYERNAIEEYLKQHNKSPTTDEKAFTLHLFPDIELKKELESYFSMKNITTGETQQD